MEDYEESLVMVNFSLDSMFSDTQGTLDDIAKLNAIISKIGGKATIHYTNYDNIPDCLIISFEKETLKEKLNRNAGRKSVRTNYTWGEIKEYRENLTEKQILSITGLTHSTYSRKLAKAIKENYQDYDRF